MENQSPFRVTSGEDNGEFRKEVPLKDDLFCLHIGNGFPVVVHRQFAVNISQVRAAFCTSLILISYLTQVFTLFFSGKISLNSKNQSKARFL